MKLPLNALTMKLGTACFSQVGSPDFWLIMGQTLALGGQGGWL